MTIEILNETIKKLIIKRMNVDLKNQERLNAKLTKLYEIKYTMLEQKSKGL